MSQDAVCILGMHRSGTSLLANILQEMGVYLGKPENFVSPNFDNPEGFFENKNIVSIQDGLLTAFGSSWNSPMPLPENWWLAEAAQAASAELEKCLTAEFGDCAIWGWKDPRTCLLLPIWERVLQERNINTRYIVLFRNPLDVAKSLALRDGYSLLDGLRLWYYYSISMLSFLGNKNCLFVDYDQLIDQPESAIAQIQAFIFPGDAENPVKPALARVKKDRRHSQSDPAELGEISQNLLELYQVFKQAAQLQGQVTQELYANKLRSYREFAWLINPNNADVWFMRRKFFPSTLFYDTGAGFCEELSARIIFKLQPNGDIQLEFEIKDQLDGVVGLRWDPLEGAVCRCKIDEICVDGKTTSVKPLGAWRNNDGYDEFSSRDPIYLFNENYDRPHKISIHAHLEIADPELVLGWFSTAMDQQYARAVQIEAERATQEQEARQQLAFREKQIYAMQRTYPILEYVTGLWKKAIAQVKKIAKRLPYPLWAWLRSVFPK
jgi:hypothetical protein